MKGKASGPFEPGTPVIVRWGAAGEQRMFVLEAISVPANHHQWDALYWVGVFPWSRASDMSSSIASAGMLSLPVDE